jgi:phosphinothricin acetyltransferase
VQEPKAVVVRAGRRSDLDAIVAIYNHYVVHTHVTFETTPVRPEERAPWLVAHLGSGPHRLVVAEAAERGLVGWATSSEFRPRAGYATTAEASVYCAPDAVGLGIGSRLYDALFRSIADEDLERIVAGVCLPNPPSVALHRRFGFREVGVFTRVGRKLGRYWDVAWFERPTRGVPAPGAHSIEETSERR